MRTRSIPPLVGHTAWARLPDERRPSSLPEYNEVVIVALSEPGKAIVQTKSGRRCGVSVDALDCGVELLHDEQS